MPLALTLDIKHGRKECEQFLNPLVYYFQHEAPGCNSLGVSFLGRVGGPFGMTSDKQKQLSAPKMMFYYTWCVNRAAKGPLSPEGETGNGSHSVMSNSL